MAASPERGRVQRRELFPQPSAPETCPEGACFPEGMLRLFSGLTGLRFHFIPAPARGLEWGTREVIRGCPGPGASAHGGAGLPRCQQCARSNLDRALRLDLVGHCFLSTCGVRMFLLPVTGPKGILGVVALRSKPPESAEHRRLSPKAGGVADKGRDPGFHLAMLLLRHLAHAVELTARTATLEAELARVNQAVTSHETEERWLRRALKRTVPGIREVPARVATEVRARHAVRDVLDRVHQEFRRPLVLSQLAREFGLNSSYLSSLFAREVGMPFKAYLTTLRMQEAQKLLRDPHQRISEVAFAVGYSSVERFRTAFRQCTGLPPTRWRDVLRAN